MRDRRIIQLLSDFYRCLNSGRIIEGSKGDDKVICGCGKTNPRVVALGHEEGISPGTGHVHHIKRFLSPATLEDWEQQERYLAIRKPN
jgi:hypothetical protein